MTPLRRFLWLAPWLLAPLLRAAVPLALGPGEMLTYRVTWVIVPSAGQITIEGAAATDPHGARLLRVVSTTSTRGLAWLLLPFQARSDMLFDDATGRLLWLGESSWKRDVPAAHTVTFDYPHRIAEYLDTAKSPASRPLPMPPGPPPTDLITALLQTRNWNLRPGEARDAVVLFEDNFYELTIHAIGYEDIWTPLGTFHCLLLEPRMDKTPPKGMFRHGTTVKVWISEDGPHLPVRFQVGFKFGAGIATLTRYRPPLAPAAVPSR